VNPGDKSAEEKFKTLSEANDVLSDPKKRKIYDQLGFYSDNIDPATAEAYARGGGSPGPGAVDRAATRKSSIDFGASTSTTSRRRRAAGRERARAAADSAIFFPHLGGAGRGETMDGLRQAAIWNTR